MKLLNNFVLIKVDDTYDGIINLSDNDKYESSVAIVKAIPKDSTIEVGSIIVFYKHTTIDVTIDNEDYKVVDSNNVLCVLQGDDILMTGNRILVKNHDNIKSIGEVTIVDHEEMYRTSGEVVSVSPNVKDINVGDNVMYQMMSGVGVTIHEKEYKIFDEKEILLVL